MQPTVSLSPEQIAFFHREGYLAIPAITTPEEVAKLRAIYDRLFESRAGREQGDQFDLAGADEEGKKAVLPQILSPSRYAPELVDTLARANGLAIAKQLFGESAAFGGDHAILKPPHNGADTPWHQDEAYWGEEHDHQSVSIWIPLQAVNLENGCMQFVPKSHKFPVLPHHSINNDPRVHGLEVDKTDTSAAVPCPLPAGGATLHHTRTLHYTGANRSDQPRRALILVYSGTHTKLAKPRDHYWTRLKQTARDQRAKEAAGQGTEKGAKTEVGD